MERLICVLVGYVFGLIQTGYIYGKKNGVDLRKKGSGNAGTTNALRTMGWKAGAVTFLGDCFKCVFAVVVVHLLFAKNYGDILPLLSMYAGMGARLRPLYVLCMVCGERRRQSPRSRRPHALDCRHRIGAHGRLRRSAFGSGGTRLRACDSPHVEI